MATTSQERCVYCGICGHGPTTWDENQTHIAEHHPERLTVSRTFVPDEPDPMLTACCGAYPTYSIALGEPTLCCKVCWNEVTPESLRRIN
jgi:hypothetical protein